MRAIAQSLQEHKFIRVPGEERDIYQLESGEEADESQVQESLQQVLNALTTYCELDDLCHRYGNSYFEEGWKWSIVERKVEGKLVREQELETKLLRLQIQFEIQKCCILHTDVIQMVTLRCVKLPSATR